MRFIDLAVAAMIGASSIAGILFLNPSPAEVSTSRYVQDSQTRSDLLAMVESVGLNQIFSEPTQGLCALLQSRSNATVQFSAVTSGGGCNSDPPPGTDVISLPISFNGARVTLEAWSVARA